LTEDLDAVHEAKKAATKAKAINLFIFFLIILIG